LLWYLILQLGSALSVNGDHGPGPVTFGGSFKSQAACEAAGKAVQHHLEAVRYVCVPNAAPNDPT